MGRMYEENRRKLHNVKIDDIIITIYSAFIAFTKKQKAKKKTHGRS